jgi:hypothetical protein
MHPPPPPLQAPVKRNMYKGISLAYGVIALTYIAISVAGFWAFGFGVYPWVLASMTEPTWAITMANIFAVVQIVGCFQVGVSRRCAWLAGLLGRWLGAVWPGLGGRATDVAALT